MNGGDFTRFAGLRRGDSPAKEQGKLFSLVIVMNTICGLAFGQLWPQLPLGRHQKL